MESLIFSIQTDSETTSSLAFQNSEEGAWYPISGGIGYQAPQVRVEEGLLSVRQTDHGEA